MTCRYVSASGLLVHPDPIALSILRTSLNLISEGLDSGGSRCLPLIPLYKVRVYVVHLSKAFLHASQLSKRDVSNLVDVRLQI